MDPGAREDEIRQMLSGTYSRCTGYHAIVQAARKAGAARVGGPR
jgi:aerobic-type carbon monoxide dehydrogenase small subunit (CoxS/CutS family)